jgi:hypothetical protein
MVIKLAKDTKPYDDSHSMHLQQIWEEVERQIANERERYTEWPKNLGVACLIVAEATRKVMDVAGDVHATNEDLRKQIIQTMAMCVRLYQEST